VRRGEIYVADLPQPIGRRPVLLVSRSAVMEVRTAVTVAPITRTIRGISSELPLGEEHGLHMSSVANCDSLQTISKEVLRRRPVGKLDADELPALDRALRFALGIRT
jgi:mRNA interferase MazF